jgi:hypothetical protein
MMFGSFLGGHGLYGFAYHGLVARCGGLYQ